MNFLFSSIGRRGYIANYFRDCLSPEDRIIGTGNNEWTSGFQSCDEAFLLPSIKDPRYIPQLLELCKEREIQAILSFSDVDIYQLSQYQEEFQSIGVLPILPPVHRNKIYFDKYEAYQFFRDQGFLTPKTFLDLPEVLDAIEVGTLSFPVILKPRCGSGSAQIFVARNLKELDVFFHYDSDILVQEKLTGQEYGLDICGNLQGQVVAVVPRKKIAMRSGETDQAEVSALPELIDFGVRLGNALNHVGPLDCDLFIQDGQIFVLEINPRFGGGYPISHLAGANFPALIYRMIKGETVEPCLGSFDPDVMMMKEYAIMGGHKSTFFKNVSRQFL